MESSQQDITKIANINGFTSPSVSSLSTQATNANTKIVVIILFLLQVGYGSRELCASRYELRRLFP